jgi:hypothetical protein
MGFRIFTDWEDSDNRPFLLAEVPFYTYFFLLWFQGYGDKRVTLPDIRNELSNRYADPREPFKSAHVDDLFIWMTKETEETIFPGRLVLATVVGESRNKATNTCLNVEKGEFLYYDCKYGPFDFFQVVKPSIHLKYNFFTHILICSPWVQSLYVS